MPRIELQIGALPAHVRTARLIAAALGRRIGMDSVATDEVKLAVGEACARAVSVHRAAGIATPIVIAFCDDNDILEITVADGGPSGAQLRESTADSGPADAVEAAAADLLRSATDLAREPADTQRGIDVASLAPGLGLALIAGLVDDMSVNSGQNATGTVVVMRWPIVNF